MNRQPSNVGGPNPANHIINNPNALLTFLQHINKNSFTKIEEWPFKISFIIEYTYDSIMVIEGSWINGVEMAQVILLTEGYDLSEANHCAIRYVEGLTTGYPDTNKIIREYYEVFISIDRVEGDGITFSHS